MKDDDDSSRKLGPTGQYPYGQLNPQDEGEVQIAIVADHQRGIIQLEFGKPIAWFGLPVQHARDLAAALVEKADELERRKQ